MNIFLNNALSLATVFEDTHPEVVSDFVNKKIGHHTIEIMSSPKTLSRLNFAEFSGLGLTFLSYGNEIRVKSPELENTFHLQIIMKGYCNIKFKDRDVSLGQGDAIMLNPHELIILDYSHDCEKFIVNVPESEFQSSVISELGHIPKSGIRFHRDPVKLFSFPSLVKFFEAMLLETEKIDSNLFHTHNLYKEIFVKKILCTFRGNFNRDKNIQNIHPCIKKIVRHIDENLKDDITIEELSDVSKVSVRSIYNMFASSFSTTPRNYIKNRKLRKVREELLSGRAKNITEIAFDYGFMHLGRLSCDYKKAFGELPSETQKATWSTLKNKNINNIRK
ncbi:MAG: AraC family transcriptional regulator [Leeuwenhoekiella sp.]|nr:MAG: AraC family transcriptional regulator [Leeuwenhoekiella sp.]